MIEKMIVYKQVYKKNNKYYSLMNYGFMRLNDKFKTNQLCYEIGEIYIDDGIQCENLRKQCLKETHSVPQYVKSGFYFWKENKPIYKSLKNKMIELGADINAILECNVEEKDKLHCCHGIRAKKFKVLREV